ncbi:MAG: 5-formyltetrahydrofolate cyclo-ligase [Bacteroidales bacterium]|nr:5-formyltetrahydrofolate cyclo-ligase [Bacteroidales bacterium]
MNSFIQDKKTLRQYIRHLKSNLSEEEKRQKSVFIWKQIEEKECFRNAGVLLLYWSMSDEVDTHDFIMRWHQEKKIVLPIIEENNLKLKWFTGTDTLRKHTALDLYEPDGTGYVSLTDIDMAIIPGIAFDKKCHRMGRGKGYYDQLLATSDLYKIGVGFDFQLLDRIPFEEHDVLMDEIIVG